MRVLNSPAPAKDKRLGRGYFKRIVAAVAAALFFALPSANFKKPFAVKEVMAEPIQRVNPQQAAQEAVGNLKSYLLTGNESYIRAFYTQHSKYVDDGLSEPVFVAEFNRQINSGKTAPLATAYLAQKGQASFTLESIDQFATAANSAYNAYQKHYSNQGTARSAFTLPEDEKEAAFYRACYDVRKVEWENLRAKVTIKSLPSKKPEGRLGSSITTGLSTVEGTIRYLQGLFAYAGQYAKDNATKRQIAEYKKQLAIIQAMIDRATEAEPQQARTLYNKANRAVSDLKDAAEKMAKLPAQAEVMVMNFDYSLKTGSTTYSYAGSLGTITTVMLNLSGGLDADFTYYNNLDEAGKTAFAAAVAQNLMKNAPLYAMVKEYAKAKYNGNIITAMQKLSLEAVDLHIKIRTALTSMTSSAAATVIEDRVSKHRGEIGEKHSYILDQLIDTKIIGEEFLAKDPWGALTKYLRSSEAQALSAKLRRVLRQSDTTAASKALEEIEKLKKLRDAAGTKVEKDQYDAQIRSKQGTTYASASSSVNLARLGHIGQYFLLQTLQKLEAKGLSNQSSVIAITNFANAVADKDPYLVPAALVHVVQPFMETCGNTADFVFILARYKVFFDGAARAERSGAAHPYFRNAMLTHFRLISGKMPEIEEAVDHYEVTDKIKYALSPEDWNYYQVKLPWWDTMESMWIPELLTRTPTRAITPASILSGDTGGVIYTPYIYPGVLSSHQDRLADIYQPGLFSFNIAGVPPAYKIPRVSRTRLLRELEKLIAQYEQGTTYAWGPMLDQAGAGGFYRGAYGLHGTAEYWGRTPEGSVAGNADVRNYGEGDTVLTSYGDMARIGRFRSAGHNVQWLEAANIVDGALGAAINTVKKQAAKAGHDMIIYLDGYREGELTSTDSSGTETTTREAKARGMKRFYYITTDGYVYTSLLSGDAWNIFRNFLFQGLEANNFQVNAKAAGKPGDNWIFNKESGRTCGYNGTLVAFTVPTEWRNRVLGTWKDPTAAAMFGTVSTTEGNEAYLNGAVAKAITQVGKNSRNAFIFVYRQYDAEEMRVSSTGTTTSSLLSMRARSLSDSTGAGSTASTETVYPAFRRYIGEIEWRRIPTEKGGTRVRANAGGGGTEVDEKTLPEAGGKLQVEWGDPAAKTWYAARHGLGLAGAYVETTADIYRLLEQNATDVATRMKNALAQTYYWSEQDAGKAGMLAAAQYMYSQLLRPATAEEKAKGIAGMVELEDYPHYAAALFMHWAQKHKILVGGGRIPGTALEDINNTVRSSLATMADVTNPSLRSSYMTSLNSQIKGLMTAYDIGAIGINADGRVEVIGSAKLREDLGEAYGSFQTLLYFKKDKPEKGYVQLVSNLYSPGALSYYSSTGGSLYLDALLGVMVPWPNVSLTKKEEIFMAKAEPAHLRTAALTPAEMKAYMQGSTRITLTIGEESVERHMAKDDAQGITARQCMEHLKIDGRKAIRELFSFDAEETKALSFNMADDAQKMNRSKQYYFRITEEPATKTKTLEIGTEKDKETWESEGTEKTYALAIGTQSSGRGYAAVLGVNKVTLGKRDINETEVMLTPRINNSTERSSEYYALVADPPAGKYGYTIVLGNKQDYEEWKKTRGDALGKNARKITIKPQGENLRFDVEGITETRVLPAIKLMGGALFELYEDENGDYKFGGGGWQKEKPGWEVLGLIHALESEEFSGIVAGHYATIYADRLKASKAEALASLVVTTRKDFDVTKQWGVYILYYHNSAEVVVANTNKADEITRQALKQHGGRVAIESYEVRRGTEFYWKFIADAGAIKIEKEIEGKPASSDTTGYVMGGLQIGGNVSRYSTERWQLSLLSGYGSPMLANMLKLDGSQPLDTLPALSMIQYYLTNSSRFTEDIGFYIMASFAYYFGAGASTLTSPLTYQKSTGTWAGSYRSPYGSSYYGR